MLHEKDFLMGVCFLRLMTRVSTFSCGWWHVRHYCQFHWCQSQKVTGKAPLKLHIRISELEFFFNILIFFISIASNTIAIFIMISIFLTTSVFRKSFWEATFKSHFAKHFLIFSRVTWVAFKFTKTHGLFLLTKKVSNV